MATFFYRNDLKKSTRVLKNIRKKCIEQNDHEMILLFNSAIYRYNCVAPCHCIKEIIPKEIKQFMQKCILELKEHLDNDLFCENRIYTEEEIEQYAADYPIFYAEHLKESISAFQVVGGQVVLLLDRTRSEEFKGRLGIKADDELFPVYQAGLVRSQILRMVLLAIKRKIHAKSHQVRLAHGTTERGYDSACLYKNDDDFL